VRKPKPGRTLTSRSCLLLLSGLLLGAADPALVKSREAEKKYQKKDYATALKLYEEARAARPGTSALDYNVGVVKFRKGEADEAQKEFSSALSGGEDGLRAKSYYNLGNCLYEAQDFDGAAKAYRKALELTPADGDAKNNLELALRMKQMQPPQSQPSDQNQENQEQNEESEQQSQPQSGNEGQEQQQQQQQQQQGQQKPENQPGSEDEKQQEGSSPQDRSAGEEEGSSEPSQAQLDPNAMKPEDAMRLLDALRDEEARAIEEREARNAQEVGVTRDW
jgi:Ca-activated chloride channel family protein